MPRTFSLADVYGAGEQIKGARQRNTLLEQQRLEQERENALLANPSTTPEQFARGGRSDVANSLFNIGRAERMDKQEALKQLAEVAQRALQLDPVNRRQLAKEAMTVYAPAFQALTGGQPNALKFDALSDQQLEQALQRVAAFGQQAPADTGPLVPFVDPQTGQPVFGTRNQAVGQRPLPEQERQTPRFRPMTPEEVIGAGLPPGTSAQVNEDTGQINVLSKRDTTASLSQKDQTTAKLKLNTVRVARQQLNVIRKRFIEGTKGPNAFGPFGPGRFPTPGGKAFDRAVDQMRSTLTALTRVPGVGAMSDFETRLDQAKFPDRTDFESVTQQQIDGIDSMLNQIESGYRDLLSGNQSAQEAGQPTAPQPAQAQITATGPNGEKLILQNGQWVPLGR